MRGHAHWHAMLGCNSIPTELTHSARDSDGSVPARRPGQAVELQPDRADVMPNSDNPRTAPLLKRPHPGCCCRWKSMKGPYFSVGDNNGDGANISIMIY